MRRAASVYGGVVAWVMMLLFILSAIDIAKISPRPGAMFIDRVSYCQPPACSDPITVQLPKTSPRRYWLGTERHQFSHQFTLAERPADLQAVYVPKFAQHMTIKINGVLVHQSDPDRRNLWNEPLLVKVAPDVLRAGENNLTMVISAELPGRSDLRPFHFGDLKALEGAYALRFAMGPGISRMALGLMVLLTLSYFVVWGNRRSDRMFLWIGLSCLSAAVFLALLGVSFPVGGYRTWLIMQSGSLATYSIFMLKFIRHFLGLQLLLIETLLLGGLIVGVLTMSLAPIHLVYPISMGVGVLAAIGGIVVVGLMWLHRTSVPRVDFVVFFSMLSIGLACGFDAIFLSVSSAPPRSIHLLHVMPLITSLVCLWLILGSMIRSMTGYERLTATLQDTVREKSDELEKSYAKLADIEKARAVQEERGRIMLDLHDGVGGQLVNTLAYLETRYATDETLRNAIEDALRDLGLMVDSIGSQDDLATLLGMMRARLDGLLNQHGVTFDWRLQSDPIWRSGNPSDNLHVARIVQEAITNAVKHADASVITVYADHERVSVSDNGRGFEVSDAAPGRVGHGIAGMRRRAEMIGASFTINSTTNGTAIALIMRTESPE